LTKFYRFLFTRSELRGILVLGFSVILIRLLTFSIGPSAVPFQDQPVAAAGSGQTAQVRKTVKVLDINSADSMALLDLTGIGPSYARRIIKYREMLGGFAFRGQLMEVYGMDSARLNGFAGEIRIDTSRLRKLDINRATFKELLAHPYLDYDQVKAIARFRDRRGVLVSPGELWAAGVLADSLWRFLSPYLIVSADSVLKENKLLVK
jgi:DNA uptake protein ComE-like DNA-binding protein